MASFERNLVINSSDSDSVQNLWQLVEGGLGEVCAAWREGRLLPLLEADFAGYLYHVLVSKLCGDASLFHLDTRLVGPTTTAKFDLVIGSVLNTEEQRKRMVQAGDAELSQELRRFIKSKASLSAFRPGIMPRIVLEFKAFPVGFTPQQHDVHFRHALEDLNKLREIASTCADGRGVVLFDGDGYLTNTRLTRLLGIRDQEDANIRVYLCRGSPAAKACWNLHLGGEAKCGSQTTDAGQRGALG